MLETIDGDPEELRQSLVNEQHAHRAHAHKCLDLGYELVLLVYDMKPHTEETFIAAGGTEEEWLGIELMEHHPMDLLPIDDWFKAKYMEYHGEPPEKSDYAFLHEQLQLELVRNQFATINCSAWHWGHVLEHLLWRELQ